jgi:hypothetical protein
MEALIQSHRQIQHSHLIDWKALSGMNNIGAHPFEEREVFGDFIYSTNKSGMRYSPMYSELNDESYIFSNCNLDMGYTSLLICKRVKYNQGSKLMSFEKFERISSEFESLKEVYCVFQDPFTKLHQHGGDDLLMMSGDLNDSLKFADKFTATQNISTLVAQIKFHINWH